MHTACFIQLNPVHVLRQRAVTLMELIASVAVAAVLVVGALTMYSAAAANSNATQLLRDVNGLGAGIKSLFAGQPTFGGGVGLNEAVTVSKAVPANWRTSGAGIWANITTNFGGDVSIMGQTYSAGRGFSISISKIPNDVCVNLLPKIGKDWGAVMIAADAGVRITLTQAIPIPPSFAATACGYDTKVIFYHCVNSNCL